ncbi:mycofactocin system transcriptional regulator [Antrihabitans stalagmiti]|uniref:mycofactocin system transcriptional regulator n=1 Tax=Antrihabitans stalagmiti TaxID=2799499 RepID=UPI0027DCD476|nr:mycofactocin system transcriptional regulator [Antrihabitans stalagmiti]
MRPHVDQSTKVGRRPSTTKDSISATAIELFVTHGFDETSIDDIAAAAGIARRTFFRYFASKNAVPWGDFDVHLDDMRAHLSGLSPDLPLAERLTMALLEFNTFPPDQAEKHRKRMELILTAPALQAYSLVMYEGWRNVVAEYVAVSTDSKPDDHGPRTAGWMMLGIALAAYEQWLGDDSLALPDLLARGCRLLDSGLAGLVAQTRTDAD